MAAVFDHRLLRRTDHLLNILGRDSDPLATGAGTCYRFYVHEGRRHHGRLVWEWLLEQANELGVCGGSAFKAMAGFGRHHVLHENTFFELVGSVTVEVEFILTEEDATKLLALLHKEKVRLFYAQIPARFGVINPDAAEPCAAEPTET